MPCWVCDVLLRLWNAMSMTTRKQMVFSIYTVVENAKKTLLTYGAHSLSTQLLKTHFKMAQAYAKDQPTGFTNRIERVAIVGVS
jgi:hypothetical protein